ncbi:phosphate ABC transporter permease subunit PstC [bacterium]|nr:phosphate ABC transporter permease subunit PstC [bacterium]NBX71455.1 phosphate ABC transporter permease subunit PstC [bacterium]
MIKIEHVNLQSFYNLILKTISLVAAWFIVAIFIGMFFQLVKGSIPAFHAFGFSFLFSSEWNPVTQQFGALTSIIGTLSTSFIALLIATPFSFGIVIFILKMLPLRVQTFLRTAIDLLAGIPSIIYGMWGLFGLAPFIGNHFQPWLMHIFSNNPYALEFIDGVPFGIGIFTAGIVMGLMVIPFIASVIYDVFEIVPPLLEESSYALGATTWETLWYVVFPYCRLGFIGGIMLGLGRALGETMAVSFVIGNAHTITTSLFSPSNSITSSLANEFNETTYQLYSSVLIEMALCLFIITSLVVFLSHMMINKLTDRYK